MPTRPADDLEVGAVFAQNLQALMHWHREHGDIPLSSPEELEVTSGVSRSQIYRYLARETVPTIERIEKLARAFNLHPWQLLVPQLDPANPPVVFITQAERRLYESIRNVGVQARNLEGGGIEADTRTTRPDSDRASAQKGKRGRPRKTIRFP